MIRMAQTVSTIPTLSAPGLLGHLPQTQIHTYGHQHVHRLGLPLSVETHTVPSVRTHSLSPPVSFTRRYNLPAARVTEVRVGVGPEYVSRDLWAETDRARVTALDEAQRLREKVLLLEARLQNQSRLSQENVAHSSSQHKNEIAETQVTHLKEARRMQADIEVLKRLVDVKEDTLKRFEESNRKLAQELVESKALLNQREEVSRELAKKLGMIEARIEASKSDSDTKFNTQEDRQRTLAEELRFANEKIKRMELNEERLQKKMTSIKSEHEGELTLLQDKLGKTTRELEKLNCDKDSQFHATLNKDQQVLNMAHQLKRLQEENDQLQRKLKSRASRSNSPKYNSRQSYQNASPYSTLQSENTAATVTSELIKIRDMLARKEREAKESQEEVERLKVLLTEKTTKEIQLVHALNRLEASAQQGRASTIQEFRPHSSSDHYSRRTTPIKH